MPDYSKIRSYPNNANPPFKRYVVVDVITSTIIDREKVRDLAFNIENDSNFSQTKLTGAEDPEKYLIAPRNSIIGKLVDDNLGKTSSKNFIMYPIFSSHLCLPVKPGEMVWGMEEPGGKVFWLSRIHEPDHVEDLNYTHGDRRKLPTVTGEIQEEPDTKKFQADPTPTFPNGDDFDNRDSFKINAETSDQQTLENAGIKLEHLTLGDIDGFEKIVKENEVKDQIFHEPVPRYTKRPGDMSIHGSNNSSITLGTERGYGANASINSGKTNAVPENDESSKAGLSEGMGAIDIVVGRGRLHKGTEDPDVKDGKQPADTRPRVIKNARGQAETHKNVGVDGSKSPEGSAQADGPEGDPDFQNDSSRIYMSMKTDADKYFGLDYPDHNGGKKVDPTPGNAAVVMKSDQIRIVARKDEFNTLNGQPINGSIRIIKEGTADQDRATIVIQPDGSIMIDGPTIIIGSGKEKGNGQGDQVFIGRDATESILLGDKLIDMLKALETKFNNHIHQSSAGPTTNHIAGGATVASAELWDTSKSKVGKTK